MLRGRVEHYAPFRVICDAKTRNKVARTALSNVFLSQPDCAVFGEILLHGGTISVFKFSVFTEPFHKAFQFVFR